MKKLYLQLISAFYTGNNNRTKALRLFFLALMLTGICNTGFAQVVVGPANDTMICRDLAVGGSAPAFTTLTPITITETGFSDISGAVNVTINVPGTWLFNNPGSIVVSFSGPDLGTLVAIPVTAAPNSFSFSFPAPLAGTGIDVITITGVEVQAGGTGVPSVNMFASAASGISGITLGPVSGGGTSFGKLGLITGPITGISSTICVGVSFPLSDPTPGGVWSSSAPGFVAVGSASGVVTGMGSGPATITHTVAGCSATYSITSYPSPAPILGARNMCAWDDSMNISSATTGGLFSSSLVTVVNNGPGTGRVFSHAPGTATIVYTLPSGGCATSVTITVYPLPVISTPPFEVCAGSTLALTSSITPGTWASSAPTVASIGSITGLVTGILPFTTVISYTVTATGCKTSVGLTVNPLPSAIAAPAGICLGATATITSFPSGGTWSSLDTNIIFINSSTGVITGRAVGSTIVTYTINPGGCYVTDTIDVYPLPTPISGPTTVCINDSILLSSAPPGGAWSSGAATVAFVNASTGWVYGLTMGAAIITYTIMPGNCEAIYSVTVNPLPDTITGPTVVCIGYTIPNRTTSTGGTWTSSNPAVGTVNTIGDVTGLSTGTTTICFTFSSTGCSICRDVTVNPNPNPITGRDSLCVGDTIVLSSTTPGGVWSSSDPSRGSIDAATGLVTGISGSPFPVTITYTAGGCFVTYNITVNAVPSAISGPSAVCIGDTIYLTNTLTGTWSVDSPARASIDPTTGMLIGISAGTVLVQFTAAGGCSATLAVVVNSKAPIAGSDRVCVGDTILLTNLIPSLSASWGINPGSFATIVSSTVHPAAEAIVAGVTAGIDTVFYTLPTGCRSVLVITVDPSSPISGPDQVCVNDSITLFNATPGGTWTSSFGTSTIVPLTSTTARLYGTGSGIAIVTYTMPLPSTCERYFTVTVNPLPDTISGPDSICVGETVTYVSTSGVVFTSSNTAIATVGVTSGDVTGVSPGTVVITATLTTGCYVTRTIVVNPNGLITGPDSVCVGSSITLTDTTTGGVWSILPPAVSFLTPSGTTTLFTGVAAEVDTILYTIPGTGCFRVHIVTVNPLPGPINGPDSLCVGQTAVLTDTPAGGTWTTSSGSVATVNSGTGLVTAVGPGVVIITYTLSTGCFVTKAITINPNPLPIVGPHDICLGDSINLTNATPGGIWSSTDPSISPVTSTGKVYGIATGTDTVIYTLPVGGCFAIHTITVNQIPVITVNHPTIKCKYDVVALTAGGADSVLGTYTWSPSYGLSATTGITVFASPTITTTYTVTGTTVKGCDSFTTVTVFVDDSLNNMRIVGKDSICAGTCDTLKASGRAGSYFNWHPAVGLSCTICDTVVACPDSTTKYWAVAIDDLGCKDSISFTVYVNPIPVITVNPTPAILCKHTPLQLHVGTTNTDDTTNIYAWSPNLFISCDTCFNPIITDTANIIYRVIAITKYGCYDSFNVKVSVLDTNRNTISNDTNICIGGTALLVATSQSLYGNLSIPTFKWLPDYALSSPDSSSTFATPAVTTTYSVAIHENQCFDDTLTVTVFVQPYPIIDITTNAFNNVVAGSPVQLIATVLNVQVKSYAWTPAGTLSCDSCFNPVVNPVANPTTYTVTVTSIHGCDTFDVITLSQYCDNSQVFIPNTFTPNGDGANDRFFVSGKGIKRITTMMVYSRWGQVVFEAHNIPANDNSFGWDGQFKGVVLSPDVYDYFIQVECTLGEMFKYTGDISIVK